MTFSVEEEFDHSAIAVLQDGDYEELDVRVFEDEVWFNQYDEEFDFTSSIVISVEQLRELITALTKTEGVYNARPME